jgi:hypothetical protein
MNKYKLLKFGHCYLNKTGNFVVGLLSGNVKHGYVFACSHAHPSVMINECHMQSRIVPNDGNWIEVSKEMFNAVHAVHVTGHVVTFPIGLPDKELPIISKMY